MMERLRRFSLRKALILPFLIQIFVVFGLAGFVAFYNGQKAVNDVASQLRTEVAARIQDRLQGFVQTPHMVNQLSANAIQQEMVDVDDDLAMELMFWQHLQTFSPVTHAYIGMENGNMHGARWSGDHIQLFVISATTGGLRHNYVADSQGQRAELEEEYEYDPRVRPWYTGAVELGEPSWSAIYADKSTGQSAITAVQPLYDDTGKLQSVLGSSFIFTQFNEFLRSLEIGKSGQTFIIERDGNLVSTSVDTPIFTITDDSTERILASESENDLIRETAVYLSAQNNDNLSQITQPQQLDFQLNGNRQFVQVTPLTDASGLDWLIVVTVPESDFMGQINASTRTTIFIFIVSLIVAILFGIYAAHRISDPIVGLNDSAQQFADGNWEQSPTETRIYELKQLESSFGSMAQQIQSSFVILEEKNDELQRLNKMKDQFLANTSHELRTPLNGIIGITESMLDGAAGPVTAEQSRNLGMVVSSGRRLYSLVNDILDLSQMERGKIELTLQTVDAHALIDTALALSLPLVGKKAIALENNFDASLPFVMADGNRLQQILHNLIGNAIKFTEEGTVSVSAELADASGDWLEIVVADTGIGIPEDKLEAIFESFEQVDASITRLYGGTGLGLAVTRQLVELHNGRIWLESTLGEGSRFHFTLPVSSEKVVTYTNNETVVPLLQAEPKASIIEQPLEDWSQNNEFTILIVDDEPVNVQVLTNYLVMQNFNVAVATDGLEALDLLQETPVDIILLDIMMPHLSGYETCQRIRQQYTANELPIIMLTAKNQVSDLVMGFAAGANDYLTKPFSRDELLSRVNTHLRLAKINTAYGRFVPHEFLHFLNKQTILDVNLGDQAQYTMTIFFADMYNFTSLSEEMTPKQNFDFINALLKRIGPIIREHDGFIDKYIGDAVMALFSESANKAVDASIAILNRLVVYNTNRLADGKGTIRLGIGLHTGTLMLGTIGELERMDTTVISDSVNLAARIEKLTRKYNTDLLISEQTLSNLSNPDQYCIRFIGEVKVSGKSVFTRVYEVFDADETAVREGKAATLELFEKGVHLYHDEQNLEAAAEQFRLALQQCKQDQVAQSYLKQITQQEEQI